jgi:hypothetical protein
MVCEKTLKIFKNLPHGHAVKNPLGFLRKSLGFFPALKSLRVGVCYMCW